MLALCSINEIERKIKESDIVNLKVLDYKTRINEFTTLIINSVTSATPIVMPATIPTPLCGKARLFSQIRTAQIQGKCNVRDTFLGFFRISSTRKS